MRLEGGVGWVGEDGGEDVGVGGVGNAEDETGSEDRRREGTHYASGLLEDLGSRCRGT